MLWLTFRNFLARQKLGIRRCWHLAVGVLDEIKQIWQSVRETWIAAIALIENVSNDACPWQDFVNSSQPRHPKKIPTVISSNLGTFWEVNGGDMIHMARFFLFGVTWCNKSQLHTAQRHQVENKSYSMMPKTFWQLRWGKWSDVRIVGRPFFSEWRRVRYWRSWTTLRCWIRILVSPWHWNILEPDVIKLYKVISMWQNHDAAVIFRNTGTGPSKKQHRFSPVCNGTGLHSETAGDKAGNNLSPVWTLDDWYVCIGKSLNTYTKFTRVPSRIDKNHVFCSFWALYIFKQSAINMMQPAMHFLKCPRLEFRFEVKWFFLVLKVSISRVSLSWSGKAKHLDRYHTVAYNLDREQIWQSKAFGWQATFWFRGFKRYPFFKWHLPPFVVWHVASRGNKAKPALHMNRAQFVDWWIDHYHGWRRGADFWRSGFSLLSVFHIFFSEVPDKIDTSGTSSNVFFTKVTACNSCEMCKRRCA